jgi:hypothetical protein
MRLTLAALALPALAFAASAHAAAKPLKWEDAFSLRDAPKGVHLKASYVDGKGRSHELEVWRDGDRRILRRTDDKLDLFAEKTSGGEYAFRIVDRAKKRLIEVNRTNLYRIGVFADWSALAGMLTRPKGAHTLRPGGRPKERTKIGECRWVRLEIQGSGAQEICWSDRLKVPLLIQTVAPAGGFTTVFQVKQVDLKVPGAEMFNVSSAGLTVIRADEDIDPSSDL